MKLKRFVAKPGKAVTVMTRLVAICVVIAAFLVLGEKYGPHQNDRVEATVYEKFFRVASAIPAYESVQSKSTAPRETFLNGNRMLHTVTTTNDSIEEVLDYYTELYSTGQVKILTEEQEQAVREALEGTGDPIFRDILEDLPELEKLLSAKVSRMEGKTLGFLGVIDSEPGDWADDYLDRVEEFAATGRLSALGKAKVVMAFKSSPRSSRTTTLAMWPDDNFNIYNFFPDETGDVPGEDVPEVPRFPGARRLLSSVQPGPSVCGRISVYEGPGTISSNRLFYRTKLREIGWQEATELENTAAAADQTTLYFRKESKECMIQFDRDGRTGQVTTSIACLEH